MVVAVKTIKDKSFKLTKELIADLSKVGDTIVVWVGGVVCVIQSGTIATDELFVKGWCNILRQNVIILYWKYHLSFCLYACMCVYVCVFVIFVCASSRKLKELSHDNINTFVGANIEPGNNYILFNYCTKGSLRVITDSLYPLLLGNLVLFECPVPTSTGSFYIVTLFFKPAFYNYKKLFFQNVYISKHTLSLSMTLLLIILWRFTFMFHLSFGLSAMLASASWDEG